MKRVTVFLSARMDAEMLKLLFHKMDLTRNRREGDVIVVVDGTSFDLLDGIGCKEGLEANDASHAFDEASLCYLADEASYDNGRYSLYFSIKENTDLRIVHPKVAGGVGLWMRSIGKVERSSLPSTLGQKLSSSPSLENPVLSIHSQSVLKLPGDETRSISNAPSGPRFFLHESTDSLAADYERLSFAGKYQCIQLWMSRQKDFDLSAPARAGLLYPVDRDEQHGLCYSGDFDLETLRKRNVASSDRLAIFTAALPDCGKMDCWSFWRQSLTDRIRAVYYRIFESLRTRFDSDKAIKTEHTSSLRDAMGTDRMNVAPPEFEIRQKRTVPLPTRLFPSLFGHYRNRGNRQLHVTHLDGPSTCDSASAYFLSAVKAADGGGCNWLYPLRDDFEAPARGSYDSMLGALVESWETRNVGVDCGTTWSALIQLFQSSMPTSTIGKRLASYCIAQSTLERNDSHARKNSLRRFGTCWNLLEACNLTGELIPPTDRLCDESEFLQRTTERLADHLGICIEVEACPAVPASAIRVDDEWFIFLDDNLSRLERAFLFCHEIAHIVLHHTPASEYGLDRASLTTERQRFFDDQEDDADAFAETLLFLLSDDRDPSESNQPARIAELTFRSLRKRVRKGLRERLASNRAQTYRRPFDSPAETSCDSLRDGPLPHGTTP